MMNKNPIKEIFLIRFPNGKWHNKAFISWDATKNELERLKADGIDVDVGDVVIRLNKDNIPIGSNVLTLSHYMKSKINGTVEEQAFETREIWFSMDELIQKSESLSDLKEDLKCDGFPVYYEKIDSAPEHFSITGPYYRNYNDVGTIEVFLYKLSVKKIKIVNDHLHR